MKSINKKWFTLVELIIVITILAILATIAFLSFQWYSSEARDSGKMSELSEIVKTIAVNEAKLGTAVTAYTTSSSWTTVNGIAWTGWALDLSKLGLNSKNKYAYIYTASGTYIIAGLMEKADTTQANIYTISSKNYFVLGTQFLTWLTLSASWTITDYAK